MKIRKILFSIFSALASISAAYAGVYPQAYLGVQGGIANTNFSKGEMMTVPDGLPLTSATIGNHVFAARGYVGYQFNDYVAAEIGYLRPRSTRFTQINGSTVPNGNVAEYAMDLSGKVFLPMAAYIHLTPYFKLGVAYLSAKSQGGVTRNGASDFGYTVHPVLGAGIGYDLTPYLNMDISYATMTPRNSSTPRIDMIFLGLTYHFSTDGTKTGVPNVGDTYNPDFRDS